MKLTYFQLEPHLSKNLSPIYIVSGDELFLKQEAIQLIRKAAKQAGCTERVRLIPEAGFDWEELYTLLHSNSMFAEKSILELDFRDALPNKTASAILQEYGKNPISNNILLIDVGKIDDKISRSAWYKSLEKISTIINIWPIPREQLPLWIINRAKKYKLQMPADAANLLADYVEGNLVAAAQAIEKIYLLKLEKPITVELVQAILANESRFTLFDFTDSLIAGDRARTFTILENLKQDGTEPILILWGITRELRLLAELSAQLKQGISYDILFQKHRIFARRQGPLRRFLTTFSVDHCREFLSQAAEIDKVIKGVAPGKVWDHLQLFCLRMI